MHSVSVRLDPSDQLDPSSNDDITLWRAVIRQTLADATVLRDNQNHARCDNQASLPAVRVLQRKLYPGIMMSGYVGQNPGQRRRSSNVL